MDAAAAGRDGQVEGPRGGVLDLLKRQSELSLSELAAGLHISKPAVLRHVVNLEQRGLVERREVAGKVGRPQARFRLTARAHALFPQAYASMSVCALRFIDERMGREGVVALLRERAREIREKEGPRFASAKLSDRVSQLVQLREEGGYMAERGPTRGTTFEVREHNCPILALAETYGEACQEEQRLFTQLLRAQVDVTHRVVAGDPVCRFVIRPNKKGA